MSVPEKKPRPDTVPGCTYRVRMSCGNLYIIITHEESKIFEVFAQMGHAGGCMMSNVSALTVAITMGLRHGVPAEVYINKLRGVQCPGMSWDEGIQYMSCADAISQTMSREKKKLEEEKVDNLGCFDERPEGES